MTFVYKRQGKPAGGGEADGKAAAGKAVGTVQGADLWVRLKGRDG
jgi:hypothetical protein